MEADSALAQRKAHTGLFANQALGEQLQHFCLAFAQACFLRPFAGFGRLVLSESWLTSGADSLVLLQILSGAAGPNRAKRPECNIM